MENPGLRTLTNFLRQVQRKAPANFSTLCAEQGRGYGMVNRYLRYCLGRGFIAVESERRTRGRYPSRSYTLTEKGLHLLRVLES
jgi:predicted transcriptional regulator